MTRSNGGKNRESLENATRPTNPPISFDENSRLASPLEPSILSFARDILSDRHLTSANNLRMGGRSGSRRSRDPPRSTGTTRPREPSLSPPCVYKRSTQHSCSNSLVVLRVVPSRRFISRPCAQKLDRQLHHVLARSEGGKKKKTLASPTTSPMLATVALLLLLVDHCPPCECVGKRIEKYREERERGGERERMCVSMCVCVSVYAYMRVCVCVCVRLVGRVRRMEGCASANTLAWQTRSLPSGVPARLTTRD